MDVNSFLANLVKKVHPVNIHLETTDGVYWNLISSLICDDKFTSAIIEGELGFCSGCFTENKLGFDGVRMCFGRIG